MRRCVTRSEALIRWFPICLLSCTNPPNALALAFNQNPPTNHHQSNKLRNNTQPTAPPKRFPLSTKRTNHNQIIIVCPHARVVVPTSIIDCSTPTHSKPKTQHAYPLPTNTQLIVRRCYRNLTGSRHLNIKRIPSGDVRHDGAGR